MSEMLIALALICQDYTDFRQRQDTQKRCVASLLECMGNVSFTARYEKPNKLIECLKKK